ncbi:hypothetical protein O988_04073 [Pseudogymnoascus sp. VKM F-3808]|nr:hypothetical protein O988_04073 [Pseudogymnoascus sp. VKM F-3808]
MRRFTEKENPIPSSSPAFSTPHHPVRGGLDGPIPSILPIELPIAILRPVAFRVLTKKHGLTITSSALQKLTTFIGRNCGSKWREGLAEAVLNFVAQHCKDTGRVIIDAPDDQEYLGTVFKELSGRMKGGRITHELRIDGPNPARGPAKPGDTTGNLSDIRSHMKVIGAREQPRLLYNFKTKHFDKINTKPSLLPSTASKTQLFRNRYNIIHQRLLRTESFQVPTANRAPTLHRSSSSMITTQQTHRLTPIANLLGRSGTPHLLLGLLTISPTGTLALSDLTGSISLDLTHAQVSEPDATWFVPGMIVLVDGIYEDEEVIQVNQPGNYLEPVTPRGAGQPPAERAAEQCTRRVARERPAPQVPGAGATWASTYLSSCSHDPIAPTVFPKGRVTTSSILGGGGGIGGTVGGKFIGTMVGTPIAEKRHITLGTVGEGEGGDITTGGGFGWVDFLGLGSERERGQSMRELESRILSPPPPPPLFDSQSQPETQLAASKPVPNRGHIAILGDLTLDNPHTVSALAKVLSVYSLLPLESLPMTFILLGNFISQPSLALAATGPVEYKEYFDILAATLSNFPVLLSNCTFVFVPGDHDAWNSSFSAGAAGPLPYEPVPSIFTTRVHKAFVAANSEARKDAGANAPPRVDGEAIWTSNPARLCLFGPTHEMVLFRDDISSRFRRHAIRTASAPAPEEPEELDSDADAQEDPSIHAARKLTQTLLDQGHLSPFRLTDRPVLWDYAAALQLYPLPTALVACDAEANAFVEKYEGCCVMNPGRLTGGGKRNMASWVEYDVKEKTGRVREVGY